LNDTGKRLALTGLLALCCTVAGATEPLFYEVEGDTVVFTNQRSSGTRLVPGFTETGSAGPRKTLPSTIYDPFIDRVAQKNDLSPQLIKAVALVESGFNPHAVSSAGAQGLMQLMPQTAQQYGVQDAFDPQANLEAGAQHLRRLLDKYDDDLTLALAAYNAGEGAVSRHQGVPAYRETVDYVNKVHEKLGRRPPVLPETRKKAARPVRFKVLADGSVLLSND